MHSHDFWALLGNHYSNLSIVYLEVIQQLKREINVKNMDTL